MATILPFMRPGSPVTEAVRLMFAASTADDPECGAALRQQADNLIDWLGGWGRSEDGPECA